MEYSKDEVYQVKYDDSNIIGEERTSSIISAMKKNSFIKFIVGMTLVLCIANFFCIYNFFSILAKI